MEEKELISLLKKNLNIIVDTDSDGDIKISLYYKKELLCEDRNYLRKGEHDYNG